MTTCPHCGRVADELVCANCGMSLALTRRAADLEAMRAAAALRAARGADLLDDFASDDGLRSRRDGKAWRLLALVAVTCLIAISIALVLLQQHGSPTGGTGLPLPTAHGGPASDGTSRVSGTSPAPSSATAHPPTPSPTTSKPTASQAAHRNSTSARPPTHRPPPGPTPSVHVVKGAADGACGPHCFQLIVTLSAFAAGTHHVDCWTSHGGQFASYDTSAVTSSDCAVQKPNASVWAVVDGKYRSNSVGW